jgi:hypothetical protein
MNKNKLAIEAFKKYIQKATDEEVMLIIDSAYNYITSEMGPTDLSCKMEQDLLDVTSNEPERVAGINEIRDNYLCTSCGYFNRHNLTYFRGTIVSRQCSVCNVIAQTGDWQNG